jgi:nucleoside-diphosphate-sugar epimerase
MTKPILVTGSAGLVGSATTIALRRLQFDVTPYDLREPAGTVPADVRNPDALARAMAGCCGVIHLAAVSRVVWGERDPAACMITNAEGTNNVIAAASASPSRPWVVLASSREVYGQADSLPATEEAPLRPMNVYARSKVMAERRLQEARTQGMRTAILRLSNVYGSVSDHQDRVIPAFVSTALSGGRLRLDGPENTFDFTHIDDTVDGIVKTVLALNAGEDELPPIHLVTGVPTTLRGLASAVIELTDTAVATDHAPPRKYDVSRFWGNPARARTVLSWEPRVPLRAGLERLIADYRTRPQEQVSPAHA